MAPIVKKAESAIDAVNSDTSVSVATTRARLQGLADHCRILIDALDIDADDDDGGDEE